MGTSFEGGRVSLYLCAMDPNTGLTEISTHGNKNNVQVPEGLIGNPVGIRSRPAAVTGDESP